VAIPDFASRDPAANSKQTDPGGFSKRLGCLTSAFTEVLDRCIALLTPRDTGLDFIETIKFINYIRSEAQKGNNNPKIEKTAFAADEYTRSPLDEDPLLWSLDDLPDADEPAGEAAPHNAADLARIAQLEDAIQRLQEVHLHHGEMIQRIMAETSSESESDKKATTAKPKKVVEETEVKDPNEARGDNGYFSGYSYNRKFPVPPFRAVSPPLSLY
jgi:hypothetical protein